MVNATACPCGGTTPSGYPVKPPAYAACCGRFIEEGGAPAGNAMELMRSRYTAYTLGDTAYLRRTWAVWTCPSDLDASTDKATRWLGLQIRRHVPIDADHAEVEFVARYKIGGRAYRLHETSRFERDQLQHWRYTDGDIHDPKA